MASAARTKAAPKKGAKPDLKTGVRIQVEDLRIGDRIVTSWHTKAVVEDAISDEDILQLQTDVLMGRKTLTEAQHEAFDRILEQMNRSMEKSERYVNRTQRVEKIEECPGQWRTHIHVNKKDCYDIRQYIWIVDTRSGVKK
jgi:hypothetical protein